VSQVLQLGIADGRPFRSEATPLPESRRIDLGGRSVEALVVQYVAYHDGRIAEVAFDFYAQDDAGAVWYLGEDVFNYEDGVVADFDGTWIACTDGPACMIMPADPRVGDVYRPENVYGTVFEEVTVQAVGVTVDGPRGPVGGAIIVRELHQDGALEDKTFAPGYGEFFTAGGGDREAVALAIPTDAVSTRLPAELETIASGLDEVFVAVQTEAWMRAAAALEPVTAAWQLHSAGPVPPLLAAAQEEALGALEDAVAAQNTKEAGQAACDALRAVLDIQLQYLPLATIDLARLEVWARQLQVDAAAGEHAGVLSDVVILDQIWERVKHAVAKPEPIAARLQSMRAAAQRRDLQAVAVIAQRFGGGPAGRGVSESR
jgi:hypothetical protein